jgi:glutathione S-transferase
MIDLHYWTTPNGHKITIFLEEAQLPYRIVPVNISKGEQFKPDFLAVSPNNRIPAIVDHAPKDGGAPISVFESGAILVYLAEKTAGRISRPQPRDGVAVLADGGARADGRSEPSLFRTMGRRRFPTRSSATSKRQTASMACSTSS